MFEKYFLSATKIDLRGNHRNRINMLTTEEGEVLSRRINANRFIECSSKSDINVKETIHEAVRAAINGAVVLNNDNHNTESSCCISCCW